MKLRDILEQAVKKLSDAGIDNAAFDAREIMKDAWDMDTARLLIELDRKLCPGAAGGREPTDGRPCPHDCGALSTFNMGINMRLRRVPLQYILGYTYFMGLKFKTTRDALIPRQDTETLCETVLENEKDRGIRLLDLCTGSGCIAVALKKLGMYSLVAATDADRDALSLAIRNASINDADIRFYHGDLFEGIRSLKTGFYPDNRLDGVMTSVGECPRYETVFDVIVSNPPYIESRVIEGLEPEVRLFEPRKALDGGEDGLLFYRRIADECQDNLIDGGRLYLEIGYDQRNAVTDILGNAGFTGLRCVKDLSGRDRVICGRRD